MQTIIFDIETTAIEDFCSLDGLEKILCISLMSYPSSEVTTYHGDFSEALEILQWADVIVGHNIINFDIPAIQKVYPEWEPKGRILDTLVLSRLGWTDLRQQDAIWPDFPSRLSGSHSLKAWGLRLNEEKAAFGDDPEDWSKYTEEMRAYCEQDVRVTAALYKHANTHMNLSGEAVILEHDFAEAIRDQWRNGMEFDEQAAARLHEQLVACHLAIEEELQVIFPPKEEPMKTRAYWVADSGNKYKTKKAAVEAGEKGTLLKPGPFRIKKTPFNPGSRVMIANAFIEKYDWKPSQFTPDGRPKVDETVLRSLDYPEAKPLAEYLMLGKRLGQLAEGKEAWLRLSKNGRIHGRINPCGAVTGRCTHAGPNLAQVPSVSAPWGKECRALFTVPRGKALVGVDLSGLELRCLAHYMAKYDGGAYAREILEGDIHTANQLAAGLNERNESKVFIYAFLYGAGDTKLGSVIGKGAEAGRRLRRQFLAKTPALARLKAAIDMRVESKSYLMGIDGRVLKIRSQHSALNTLLQSAGAVVVKKATVYMNRQLAASGIDFKQVAHIHDEIQFECNPEDAEMVGKVAVTCIQRAGDFFNFRCPLDGEYSIGNNWAETH